MSSLRTSTDPDELAWTRAYDYTLPEGLVARYPAARRDGSRLLVLPRAGGRDAAGLRHLRFSDLPDLLSPGDVLVVNESRVLPVRLLGVKPSGARGEVLLLRPLRDDWVRWEALVRPGAKLKPGRRLVVAPEPAGLEVEILDSSPDGTRTVDLRSSLAIPRALDRHGSIPLPPYLEREEEPLDRERYQTVYARAPGSAAAPTAGLHFTPELLSEVEARGVSIARVTLHVGPGTFRPVDSERIQDHRMHRELWSVPDETARAVTEARSRGGKVWAVGTTVVRTLETAARVGEGERGHVLSAGSGTTELFIVPGFPFRMVDGLITNFHLPRSTLLMLVCAFGGHEPVLAAYREAVRQGYRFFSYGDAMAILPGDAGSSG